MKTKIITENEILKKLESSFSEHFDNPSDTKYFLSPASIILLGDHTQYNDGIMISVSFDSFIGIALKKTDNDYSVVYNDKKYTTKSLNEFDFDTNKGLLSSLGNLFKHIAKEEIVTSGFECCIENATSKVFGLGNHAAITMGFLKAMDTVFGTNLPNQKLVELAVTSEKELFGEVVSKPLYYSSLANRENTLMYYDTRSDYKKFLFIDDKVEFVISNTNHAKENFHERCKDRIQECEVGVKGLRLYIWGIKNLRDVEEKFLERHIHMLPKRLYSRCLYNVIARKIVEEAYKSLRFKKCEDFAKKLTETHLSLSKIYDISSNTMDELVKIAEDSKLSLGSKMVSCSYFDSIISLVYKKNLDKFSSAIQKGYSKGNGVKLEIENYSISGGARQLKNLQKAVAN